MKTPETSRLFEKRINRSNGVEYYVLTERVAPYQQGFYFVNNSMTNDGRYLWLYCQFPPNLGRILAVIDFETDELTLLPDSMFWDATPLVDPDTGIVYFVNGNNIYMRSPRKEDSVQLLHTVPTTGAIRGLATHLTLSPDKSEFFLDIREGQNTSYVGTLNRQTGKFTKWADAEYHMNHGQINPVNPDLALCAYDGYKDPVTGISYKIPSDENGVYQRLWTVTRDGKLTNYEAKLNYATHEWWSHDGKKIYYVNRKGGIHKINLETGEHTTAVTSEHAAPWHAFSNKAESCYVYDEYIPDEFNTWYRGIGAKVKFYNAKTDKSVDIVSEMPRNGHTPTNQNNYHIDPHPRFTENEQYIVFTTSELGGADLAIVNVAQLLELTQ